MEDVWTVFITNSRHESSVRLCCIIVFACLLLCIYYYFKKTVELCCIITLILIIVHNTRKEPRVSRFRDLRDGGRDSIKLRSNVKGSELIAKTRVKTGNLSKLDTTSGLLITRWEINWMKWDNLRGSRNHMRNTRNYHGTSLPLCCCNDLKGLEWTGIT